MRSAWHQITPATRRFLFLLGILLAGVLACNILVAWAAQSSQRQHMLRRITELPEPVDCLFIGNSLVEAGVDTQVLTASWPAGKRPLPTSANLALGATSPVEHALILRAALEHPLHPRLIVYGFMDDQLFSEPSGSWQDLVGNRALSFYFADHAARLYRPGSRIKYLQLRGTAALPILAERSSLWGKVDSLRRILGEIGMPHEQFNRFGRVRDFNLLEAKDSPTFDARLRQTLERPPQFSRSVQEIIELARREQARLVFLEMPMPSHHRRTFYSSALWGELQQRIQTLAAQEEITYIPASDWVRDDSAFQDATHLSREGAQQFTRQLAAAVEPMLAPSAVALSKP